jgi:broad specificity phosphatase PhoE
MALTLYFLRHGQTPMSRDNVFCGSGLNPDLTTEGIEMAESFASAYESVPWKAVYASPLQRTMMTAAPLCKRTGATIEQRDDLKEIGYGKWEGKSVAEVDREYHDDYIRWTADPAWHAPTGGEMAIEIARRSIRVIEEIKEKYAGGNVLVVSHKATIRIMVCSLLGIDVGRFRFRIGCPVCSVSVVEFITQGPLLQVLADRAHLSERLRSLPGT